jgi:hypothetical protein
MSYRNRAAAVITTVLSILIVSLPIRALASQDNSPIVYAGFAFEGDYRNQTQLYPSSAEISVQEKGFLDRVLREKLRARPELMRRVTLETADRNLDLSSVAFALVEENLEVQRLDGKYWVILTMQANVLAFNKRTNSIVASYPVRMRFTTASSTEPSPAARKDMVRAAYTNPDPQQNIFDQWLNRFEKVQLRNGAVKYLRVTDVGIEPDAEKVIVDSGKSVGSIKNQVANFLEAAVAESAHIPIVPNSVGDAIGSKMACRFANGEEMMLVLPQPDFSLKFVIRGFALKKLEKPEYFQDIYRVKGTVALGQPDLNKVYLDEQVYGTDFVTRPRKAEMQVSEWDQYYKTLQSLVFGVAKELTKVEETWLAENAARGAQAKAGFVNVNNLFQELNK